MPLPDGWVASAGAPGVLMVGPKGRVVLTLERRSAAIPSLELLTAAVEAEGGANVTAAVSSDEAVVRYAKAASSGLLQVRTLENGVLLLCASTPQAGPGELEAAQALCTGVRLEAVR